MNLEQWPVKILGELCKIQRGASPRPIKSHLTDDEDGVNWIKMNAQKFGWEQCSVYTGKIMCLARLFQN